MTLEMIMAMALDRVTPSVHQTVTLTIMMTIILTGDVEHVPDSQQNGGVADTDDEVGRSYD